MQVNTVHVNPMNCNLMMTGSNDWTARIFDIRNMPSSVGSSSSHASGALNGILSGNSAVFCTSFIHCSAVFSVFMVPCMGDDWDEDVQGMA